jgi:hypothetical protein
VFQLLQWSRCWRICNRQSNSWHPWLPSISTNKYYSQRCRFLWTHWWWDCCSSPPWFAALRGEENGKQKILQDPGYSYSLPCFKGKYPLCLLECQLLLILCAYFCVNSCDECITPSHRTWQTVCNPGQNTKKFARFYNMWLLMCNVSPNPFGMYLCEVMFTITWNITEIHCDLYSLV